MNERTVNRSSRDEQKNRGLHDGGKAITGEVVQEINFHSQKIRETNFHRHRYVRHSQQMPMKASHYRIRAGKRVSSIPIWQVLMGTFPETVRSERESDDAYLRIDATLPRRVD